MLLYVVVDHGPYQRGELYKAPNESPSPPFEWLKLSELNRLRQDIQDKYDHKVDVVWWQKIIPD